MLCGLIFTFGFITGSFLNVCIYRIPRGQSLIYPSSRCNGCGESLKAYQMIPVISYIALGGRCSCCKMKISFIYPTVELLTGVMFVILFYRFGVGFDFLKYIVLTSILIVISFIDVENQIIPDLLIAAGLAWGTIFALMDKSCPVKGYFMGMIVGGGLLFVIAFLSRGGMGGGDVKLMAVIGLFMGWQFTLLTLFLAFVSGGIIGFLLVLSGKKTRKDAIPFAPFLSISALVTILAGQAIISCYLNLV